MTRSIVTARVSPLAWLVLVTLDVSPHVSCRGAEGLPRITIAANGKTFVTQGEERPWHAVGVNYDRDAAGRLLEDYWSEEWAVVEEDLREIRQFGWNTVRIHLQIGRFLDSAEVANRENLQRLDRLLTVAGDMGLYVNLTGLGCYHRADVPPWYSELAEEARWEAQCVFWKAVAGIGRAHTNVFCYDLMNEPVLPGATAETDWLAGELGGKHFVQRIALDLRGRSREEVAREWVAQLCSAIREVDQHTLLTVGVIPWALVFPKAKPLFYAPDVAAPLDFVSVHFYPKRGQVEAALDALAVYSIGKPLVVEELFPLHCSTEEMLEFVERSRPITQGWLSFYWGDTPQQHREQGTLASAIVAKWLDAWSTAAPQLIPPAGKSSP
jgi:hypothetical protein